MTGGQTNDVIVTAKHLSDAILLKVFSLKDTDSVWITLELKSALLMCGIDSSY